MKKLLAVLLMVMMVLTVAGCSKKEEAEPVVSTEPEKAEIGIDFIRIGTASMGGNFYTMGNAVAQLINDKIEGVNSSAQASSGGAENIREMAAGNMEMSITQSTVLIDSFNGTGSFEGEKIDGLSTVAIVSLSPYHVFATKESGIKSVADLKGKNIAVGPMGGTMEVNANMLLAAYGIGATDYTPMYGSNADCFDMLKMCQADAMIYATSIGASQIVDFLNNNGVMIEVDKDAVDKILAEHPELGPATIPAGSYEGQENDITTVALSVALNVPADLDDEFVYQFTKAFYENNDYLLGYHAYFAESVLDNYNVGVVYPYHPAAERYLKEAGAIK